MNIETAISIIIGILLAGIFYFMYEIIHEIYNMERGWKKEI